MSESIDNLRKRVDWTKWRLDRFDRYYDAIKQGKIPTDDQRRDPIRFAMIPLVNRFSGMELPLFRTELEALRYAIYGAIALDGSVSNE